MYTFLIKLVLVIVEKVFRSATPTVREGTGAGKLEARLRAKLKKDGWK